MAHALLAARVFDTPLLIASGKLDAILAVLGPRLGLDLPLVAGPETEAKAPGKTEIVGNTPATKAYESRVAVIQIVGTLANRVSGLDAMSGMTGYETLAEEIDRVAADPAVDGILLEVDSFGGEAAGCFDLADRIHAAAASKPVYGVANQYAMSAGYALLSQCGRVFIPQSGEVGSIGVVTTHVDMTGAAEQEGVKVTHIHAGARKVDLSPWRALSPEARERLEADVEQLYDQFLTVVDRGRAAMGFGAAAARDTEAGTFIGEEAVRRGLADKVGTKGAALDALHAEIVERKRMKDLEKQNAALTAECDALKAKLAATIATYEKRESLRLAAEDRAYLESLAARSAEMQAPIDADDLSKVKGHLDAGHREFACELGAVLLKAAEAKSGKPITTKPLAPPSPDQDREAAIERGRARLRKRAGTQTKAR